MTPDEHPLKRRKPNVLRYILIAFGLLFALFAYQLLGPNPPIRISKQTTYITTPLLPSGLPDYYEYYRNKQKSGVTPDNNAAILMWQAFGPGTGGDAVSQADWQLITNELQFAAPYSKVYPADIRGEIFAKQIGEWVMENSPDWQRALSGRQPFDVDPSSTPEELGRDTLDRALRYPWKSEQLPPLANWIQSNQAAIDLLVEASKRPRFYTPLTPPNQDEGPPMSIQLLCGATRIRTVVPALVARAMLRIAEEQYELAWHDLQATYRWARLVAQGPYTVEQLIAVRLEKMASQGVLALLERDDLPPALIRQIHQSLLSMTPTLDAAKCFDEGERLSVLDAIVWGSDRGVAALLEFTSDPDDPTNLQLLDWVSFDWNVALRECNQQFDQLVAASKQLPYSARMQTLLNIENQFRALDEQLDESRTYAAAAINGAKRSQVLSAAIITSYFPSLWHVANIECSGNTHLDLTRLAAALAVYRADQGEYPADLSDLVPSVLPQLPTDLYNSKPFVYQLTKDGYLLYSLGENGIDDGGSNEFQNVFAGHTADAASYDEIAKKVPPDSDDHALRVPTPAFALPKPNAAP